MDRDSREFKIARNAIFGAAAIILDVYDDRDFNIHNKSDNSPVTKADLNANNLIIKKLTEAFPEYGILSEESVDDEKRLTKEFVWIVDPLDGTKDFIKKDNEFATNIALAQKGTIIMGLIMIPTKGELYYAFKGQGSYLEKNGIIERIYTSNDRKDLVAFASREHFSEEDKLYLEKHKDLITLLIRCGSAYKACLIACGQADVQIKIGGNSKEWDIAPCDLLVSEAGGSFTKPNGEKFTYNKKDVYNKEGYLIMNRFRADLLIK